MTNIETPKVSLHLHNEDGDLPGLSSEHISFYVPSATIALIGGKCIRTEDRDGRRAYTFRRAFNACRERLAFNPEDVYFIRLYKKRKAVEKIIGFIEDYFKKNSLEVKWEIVDVVNKPKQSNMTYIRCQPEGPVYAQDLPSIKYMFGLITNILSIRSEIILKGGCMKDIFDEGLRKRPYDKQRMFSRRLLAGLLPPDIHSYILQERPLSKLLPQVFDYLLERNPWEDPIKTARDIRKITEKYQESGDY